MKLHRDRSEQVEGAVQVYLFSDLKLKFRFCHIVKKKFQYDRTTEASSFDLEIAET